MLTPLPAASLTICLALPSRPLCRKLRRGRSQGGEVGVRERACGCTRPTGGRGRGPRGARSRAVYIARMRMWKGCRKQGGTRLGKEPRKDTCLLYLCSLIDASRNVQGREEVCSQMCQRALTETRRLRLSSSPKQPIPEHSQRRIALKALSKSGSSLGAEVIALETVNGRRSRDCEECQWALTERQTLRPSAHLSEVTELLLSPSHSLVMPSGL